MNSLTLNVVNNLRCTPVPHFSADKSAGWEGQISYLYFRFQEGYLYLISYTGVLLVLRPFGPLDPCTCRARRRSGAFGCLPQCTVGLNKVVFPRIKKCYLLRETHTRSLEASFHMFRLKHTNWRKGCLFKARISVQGKDFRA